MHLVLFDRLHYDGSNRLIQSRYGLVKEIMILVPVGL